MLFVSDVVSIAVLISICFYCYLLVLLVSVCCSSCFVVLFRRNHLLFVFSETQKGIIFSDLPMYYCSHCHFSLNFLLSPSVLAVVIIMVLCC